MAAGSSSVRSSASIKSTSSQRSTRSKGKLSVVEDPDLSENTPLLSHRNEGLRENEATDDGSSELVAEGDKNRLRWPTVVALTTLCLAVIAILVLGFAAPSVVKQYVQEASIFEPTGLSIAEFTNTGVHTRVRGSYILDASRVMDTPVRNIGRFGAWLGREVETGETDVEVYLPEYGNILLGTVAVPPIKVNIKNGHQNDIDFVAELKAGDTDGIRGVANDWLGGRLGQLSIKGVATVPIKSGIFPLGSQKVSETVTFQEVSSLPDVNITKLNIHELSPPGQQKTIKADVSATIGNNYPVEFAVPPLQFDIFVPNCAPGDAKILIANATTDLIDIKPKQKALVSAHGFAHQIPESLITICPGTSTSPLDLLLKNYIQGLETVIYVRGGEFPSSTFPQWLEELLGSITVPVSFTSHGLSHLIKRFSMSNVQVYLPDPLAEPDTPEAQPKFSSQVSAVVDLPKEMNFPLNVSRVQSYADVYYHEDKLGYIDLRKWQNATVKKIEDEPTGSPAMLVQFDIHKAPLHVVDDDLLTEILQKLIFGREDIPLQVKSNVTAEVKTSLGKFVVRDIPATGDIVINPPNTGDGLASINPSIESLKIIHTTKSSLLVRTNVSFTNPTNYSANIPYVDVKLVHNSTEIAHLTARDLIVSPGRNTEVIVDGLWNPLDISGDEGVVAGRDLLSQYVSGHNTTVTLKAYNGTIPALPDLGQALSGLAFEVVVPKLRFPSDGEGGDEPDDKDKQGFIKDATLHLWSTTADFTLRSPLPSTTLFVTSIDATAFFNHTTPIGKIEYDTPFPVPPGSSLTPRLPVELDLNGAGYDAVKDALGGTLEIDAVANIGVKLGEYLDTLYYKGKGIGARVRL